MKNTLFTMLLFVSTIAIGQVPSDYIGYWSFDNHVLDETGANNGTLQGAQYIVEGAINQAVNFDGADDYVDIFNHTTLPVEWSNLGANDDYTISAWIKTIASSGTGSASLAYSTIIELRGEPDPSYYVTFNFGLTNNRIHYGRRVPAGTDEGYSGNTEGLNDGTWHHIAVVVNNDNYIFYLDGNNDGSGTFSRATGDASQGNSIANMQIGVRSRNGGEKDANAFAGSIDEVMVYNRAITSSEISELYNNSHNNIASIWKQTGNNVYLNNNYKLGININSIPANYKLAVKGEILAEGVKVSLNQADWSDFVFADSYTLRPLDEVETFIKENKHLPEVPSAEQVGEQGIDLAKMDAVLLQKIEELTLYMIDMKKENQQLAEKNAELEKLVKELVK